MDSKKTGIFFGNFYRSKEPTKIIVNMMLVLTTAYLSIMYSNHVLYVHNGNQIVAGAVYAFKYIPIILATAYGGAVPGMMSVLMIFFYRSIISSSFSYLTFIYLIVVCVIDRFSKNHFFSKIYKTLIVVVTLQFVLGDLWGILLWLLSGKTISSLSADKLIYFFLNEFAGAFIACMIVFLTYKYMPDEKKRYFSNGKYYIDNSLLSDDERYEVEGHSRVGRVVMRVIVFEAIILGVSAEIASNTLVPTMKYINASKDQVIVIEEDYDYITNTEFLESRVSFKLSKEAADSQAAEVKYSMSLGLKDSQFSVKLAMLISIIVIPLAVFVNRYAQRRIAEPIRVLSKAVSDIYNSQEGEINEKVNEVHELRLSTGDEIENLYRAVDLTFYRLMEYIELVKSRQNIEDQLEVEKSANEAKSRFLSNISHEIRTPINAVLGFDEMILRESTDESIIGYARDIHGAGKTLLTLINDILDFSKIEAGKMVIIPVEYELSSVINDLVNMASMRAKDKNLKFNVEVNKELPHILYGDEVRIKQCILNILTNAVKYTEEGSVLLNIDYEDVILSDEDDEDEEDTTYDDYILLKVKVTDTGIGIKEEDIEKLSTAFERIDEKRNRTIEGTGLGINIVNSLLTMMDSKLNVESVYGKGSVFSFNIKQKVISREPIGDFAKTYKETVRNDNEYSESFHAPDAKILIVDDTRTNLTVIEGLLKKTQIQIDTATSGKEALEKVKVKKYDIIFLDHRMPEMDGIQTFHAMQELLDNPNADTPVVALTANAISGSREMYYSEGFSNYMSKPVDPGKLEEMILGYLPGEIVKRPGDEGFVSDSGKGDEESIAAMQELLTISGVDIEYALERCGSPEAARDVMKDFRLAISERSEIIERTEREGDIANYTIYVHGLKSSARAIGAIDLSEKAEYLEKCGNENWVEEIHELTPELLELYRSYLSKLEILATEDDEGKELIDPSELEGAYNSIKEFVSGSYFDSADDIMKMLEDYKIPDEYKKKHEEVKRLLAAVDRDGLLNIL
ncbi:response regulator [Butyrivibrio sp. YAB3001]|uniref:response regulator n=1 Tax=Butyrivibrio sp. YAB3001 TaxID=1520812 RepID=UPI0008F65339|nr:response regulator [Butyrivibrio sp. YAB3001]SFC41247.1 Signal transduction histidine kinase [Butyrivibrio sp. YAB3001]